jgi:hypothetical protein
MIQQNKGDIHLFTTNHPWFLEIGLSSFTTGTLIDWWNQKTADGRYLNRRHINQASPSDPLSYAPNGLDKLLGITPTTEFFWDGWKPNREIPNAGRFKKQNLKGALNNAGGSDTDKWEYKGKNINDAMMMNSLKDSEILYAMGLNGTTLVQHYNVPDNSVNNPSTLLKVIKPLYGLIQLNKWMVIHQNYFPRKLWGAAQDVLIPDWALLTEIKCSKAGPYLQWSGPVTFYVDNGVFDRCSITENVSFNLYLGNESMMKSGNNAITIKNLTIVGPKVNAIGTIPDGDGESIVPNTTDTAAQTAAPLDVQINPVTGKWQSGNKNILARLTTRLDKAPNGPSNAHLAVSNTAEDFADEKNTYSFIPSTGLAMPITDQNFGGLRLAPTYEMTREARCSSTAATEEKNKKITVTVYNINSVKEYSAEDMVLLTEIDGRWYVSSLGEPNAATTDVVTTSVGKWGSFTYMATSSEFFFKGKKVNGNARVNVTPRSAELNFHKLYYKHRGGDDHPFNYGTTGIDYGTAGGYDSGVPFNTSTHEEWFDERGWFQTTSFDYLDSQIFGIRGKGGVGDKNNDDKCSISSTSATINAAGKSIFNKDRSSRNSAHTGTFFGCVFPAGYDGTNVYDNARAWDVVSASKGSISTQADYFDTSNPANISPFENIPERNTSNAKCDATFGNPLTPPQEGPRWSRGSDKPDASLFELGLNDGRKTIPADVMLNASPDGTYGSPIKPIGLFNEMNTAGVKSNAYIYDLVTGGAWLCKRPNTGPGTPNPNESAFDFKPRKNGNLMFRPLKLEAYLQFGLPIGIKYGTEDTLAKNLFMSSVQKDVGGFYAEAARTQTNYKFPISYYAPEREQHNCSANRVVYEVGGPLKWGGWVPNPSISPKPSYGGRLHEAGYWNTSSVGGGMNWTTKLTGAYEKSPQSNWEGAAAFGVITTSNKVKANESIKFTTQNLYGMSAAAGPAPRSTSFGDVLGIVLAQDQTKTWGVGNLVDSYKQAHIIDLSVRIYQGHDSSSTVYDPRYFAVHHFNPGVEFLDGVYRGGAAGSIQVNDLGLVDPRNIRNLLQEDFKNLKDSDGNILNSVKYNYQQASGVDIKIPSRYKDVHTEGSTCQPVTLNDETYIFSDATSEGAMKNPPIMLETYWNVDPRRTGKLLPYRYEMLTLTIPADIGGYFSTSNNSMILKSQAALDRVLERKHCLIVEKSGTDYKKGDIVGISALNILLRVEEVHTDGGITKLKVINNGENLPLSFCMPNSKQIGSLTPQHKVTTIALIAGSTGKDFDAYFVCSQVRKKIKCDPKPLIVKQNGSYGDEIVRIAANKAGPTHKDTGGTAEAESESYIDEPYDVSFTLDDAVKSADSTYDIFFHFHNDITMTWLACGAVQGENGQPHGDSNNPTESIEQHITIESISLT